MDHPVLQIIFGKFCQIILRMEGIFRSQKEDDTRHFGGTQPPISEVARGSLQGDSDEPAEGRLWRRPSPRPGRQPPRQVRSHDAWRRPQRRIIPLLSP